MNGSCLCGSVKFEINTEILRMYQCHCEQCRKQTGTGSSCGSVVTNDRFVWISGETKIKKWEKDSGFTSHFCSNCGSSVPNKFRGQELYWIPVGLVEGNKVETVANIFSCEKASWSNVSSQVNSYATKPDIELMVKLLCDESI
jgi:hypothetical protein